jgi:hypothetical protein
MREEIPLDNVICFCINEPFGCSKETVFTSSALVLNANPKIIRSTTIRSFILTAVLIV